MEDVDQRADSQATRLWIECATRRYDFGRAWRSAARMRRVTKEGLARFFDECVAAGGPRRRRLSTHVFATRGAPQPLRVDALPDEFWPPQPDGIGTDWAADRAVV